MAKVNQVKVKSCKDCPICENHVDSAGYYYCRMAKKTHPFLVYNGRVGEWINANLGEIPDWCPAKNGGIKIEVKG